MARPVDFLIAGTPRSGTTLVQRLASELDGVRVPPETHFFAEFLPDLATRCRFPLAGDDLLGELRRYAGRAYLDGVDLDPAAVAAALGGRAGDPVALFCAVVRAMAGDGRLVGEKTPGHLAWWRPLATALPGLKVVAVVRDPRGVVASFRRLRWGGEPVQNATRWNADAAAALAARARLGAARCLLLRYEDVVADPAAARAALARFLGADAAGPGPAAGAPGAPGAPGSAGSPGSPGSAASGDVGGGLFPEWEAWKAGAAGEVDAGRATAWRGELDAGLAADVAAVCRPGMAALGYDAPSRAAAWARLARMPPGVQARRLVRAWRNARARATVRRLSRGWGEYRERERPAAGG